MSRPVRISRRWWAVALFAAALAVIGCLARGNGEGADPEPLTIKILVASDVTLPSGHYLVSFFSSEESARRLALTVGDSIRIVGRDACVEQCSKGVPVVFAGPIDGAPPRNSARYAKWHSSTEAEALSVARSFVNEWPPLELIELRCTRERCGPFAFPSM